MAKITANELPILENPSDDTLNIKNTSETEPKNEDELKEEWMDVLGSGDLKIKTIVNGNPNTRPQASDLCTIRLKAELEDGTVVEEHNELEVECNGSEVIQGLDLVLSLLDVGQKVKAVIQPRFGYGTLGLSPNIPSNATLTYTVEMLKVDMAPELTNVIFESRKKKALFKKDKGNWWYSRGDAHKAIQCYRSAVDLLVESTPYTDEAGAVVEMPEETFRDFVQLKLIIYNNLAASQLMIDAYDSALVSVEHVIRLEPNNVKALFRKGKILAAKGNTDEAVEVFTKLSMLEPENNAVKKELHANLKRQANEKLQAKSLYRKMLGAEKKVDKKTSHPSQSGPSPWTKFLGGAAVATITAALAYGISFKYKSISFWE